MRSTRADGYVSELERQIAISAQAKQFGGVADTIRVLGRTRPAAAILRAHQFSELDPRNSRSAAAMLDLRSDLVSTYARDVSGPGALAASVLCHLSASPRSPSEQRAGSDYKRTVEELAAVHPASAAVTQDIVHHIHAAKYDFPRLDGKELRSPPASRELDTLQAVLVGGMGAGQPLERQASAQIAKVVAVFLGQEGGSLHTKAEIALRTPNLLAGLPHPGKPQLAAAALR